VSTLKRNPGQMQRGILVEMQGSPHAWLEFTPKHKTHNFLIRLLGEARFARYISTPMASYLYHTGQLMRFEVSMHVGLLKGIDTEQRALSLLLEHEADLNRKEAALHTHYLCAVEMAYDGGGFGQAVYTAMSYDIERTSVAATQTSTQVRHKRRHIESLLETKNRQRRELRALGEMLMTVVVAAEKMELLAAISREWL
jgi:hypothetical protein